jgi:hypothetical protein
MHLAVRAGGRRRDAQDAQPGIACGAGARQLTGAVGRAVVEHADLDFRGLGGERVETGRQIQFFIAHRQEHSDARRARMGLGQRGCREARERQPERGDRAGDRHRRRERDERDLGGARRQRAQAISPRASASAPR